MTSEAELALKISDLEDKLAIATGEDKMRADVVMNELEYYKNKSAELELEIARLRDALEPFVKYNSSKPVIDLAIRTCDISNARKALSTPHSTTALQELINEVERRTIERCAVACDLTHGGWHGDDSDVWLCMREIRKLPTGNLKLEDLK